MIYTSGLPAGVTPADIRLTRKDVARTINCDIAHVDQLIRDGHLKATRLGSRVVVSLADLRDYYTANENPR